MTLNYHTMTFERTFVYHPETGRTIFVIQHERGAVQDVPYIVYGRNMGNDILIHFTDEPCAPFFKTRKQALKWCEENMDIGAAIEIVREHDAILDLNFNGYMVEDRQAPVYTYE